MRLPEGYCTGCGGALSQTVRDGKCIRCGAPAPPSAAAGASHGGRLTNFGYGVVGWLTGFFVGLSVACCHLHRTDVLRQRHVLTPLITAIAGAAAYGLVGKLLAPELRLGFERLMLSVTVGVGAAALVSAGWPCRLPGLAVVALVVAVGANAMLARSSFMPGGALRHR